MLSSLPLSIALIRLYCFIIAFYSYNILIRYLLDYCNSLYHNLPNHQLNRLQQIQNSLARAVVKAPESTHMGHSHEMSDNRSPGDIFLYIPQVDEC